MPFVANAGEVPDCARPEALKTPQSTEPYGGYLDLDEARRKFAEHKEREKRENERILGSFLQRACHESSGDAQTRERRTREIRNTFGFGIDFPPKNINPECDPDDVNAYYDMTCEFFRQFCNGELTRMWEAGEKVAPIERIELMLTHAVAFGFQYGCKFEAEIGAATQS